MIVDFNSSPSNSLIYTSGIILNYLKCDNGNNRLEDIFKYCMLRKMEYSTFFLSLDWLFLLGIIKKINESDEVILCD